MNPRISSVVEVAGAVMVVGKKVVGRVEVVRVEVTVEAAMEVG